MVTRTLLLAGMCLIALGCSTDKKPTTVLPKGSPVAGAGSNNPDAGSGRDEPTLMVIDYGRGRVFHTTAGHDVYGLSSVDFIVTLQRGTEWAATGRVTQKLPPAFPTADTVSYRADIAALDPSFRNGLDSLTVPRR